MTTEPILNALVRPADDPLPIRDPLQLIPQSLTKLYSIWVNWTYPFASRGRRLSVHWTCDLSRPQAHRIKLGSSIQIRKDAILEVVAPLDSNEEPIIVVDDNCLIAQRCLISARNGIHIERDVIMGQGVLISDHGHTDEHGMGSTGEAHSVKSGRIRIGKGSWLGKGATIICTQGELILGRNCVVAANAVVTESFPPYSVIFGNPGIVIRQFDPVQHKWVSGPAANSKGGVGSPQPAEGARHK